MSPTVQQLFLSQIAPILVVAVPRVVPTVGSEDADELVQDALVTACKAVHSLEQKGKKIIPKSVAYYTLQRLKSGRRSYSGGRTDVMSPGCQLDGNSAVESMDEPANAGDEDEDLALGDVLASRKDDPAQIAIRNADWSEFLCLLEAPQQYIVRATAEGQSVNQQAEHLRVGPSAVCSRRATIAKRARQFWGDSVLEDA